MATGIERAPAGARIFVLAFLTAFVLCGFLGLEAWPLTGWRLFSHLRTSTLTTWRAETIDPEGHVTSLDFSALPRRYRNFALIMTDFSRQSPDERAVACATWAHAAQEQGRSVASLRIYRLESDLSQVRAGRHAAPMGRKLVYSCTASA